MKIPITIGIILLLFLGVFIGVAIEPGTPAGMQGDELQITTDPVTGTLYIMSSPKGATIFINSINHGTTNTFVTNVPEGDQNLTLVKAGYQPYTTIVTVPAGSLKAIGPITLTKGGGASPDGTGTLYIMSSPTGAKIFMNGTDYGTTNQFVKDVPAGAQSLILIKEGYQPKIVQVDVPVGGLKVIGPITLSSGTLPGGTVYPGTIQRAYSSYPCYTLTYSDASSSYTVYLPANEITYEEGGIPLPNPIPNPVAVDYVGPIDYYHYTLDFRYQGVIYSAPWNTACPQKNPYIWGDANHCNIPFEDKYFGTVYIYSWDLAKNDWVKTPAEGVLVTIYARDCDPPCGTGEIFEVGTTHSDSDGKWHKTTGQTYSGEGYVTYSLAGYPPGQDDLDNAPFCIED